MHFNLDYKMFEICPAFTNRKMQSIENICSHNQTPIQKAKQLKFTSITFVLNETLHLLAV